MSPCVCHSIQMQIEKNTNCEEEDKEWEEKSSQQHANSSKYNALAWIYGCALV